MRTIVRVKYYKLNKEILILRVNDVLLLIYSQKKRKKKKT